VRAVDEAERHGAAVEAARAELALAEVDVQLGIGGAGVALAGAADRLDALGLLPLVVRARDDRGGRRSAPAPRRRAVLVSDLVGSTELNVRSGDERYVDLLAEHDHLLRVRMRAHRGVEFKHTGDGFCVWFADPADAARCALGVVEDLERWNALHPDASLQVRVGISVGSPIERGTDLFGATVALAARLCAASGAAEVYATDDVAARAAEDGIGVEPVGRLTFKGFPTGIDTFRLVSTVR
jgi:class 3 adenylate cyclase